jgi:hypothetical protein
VTRWQATEYRIGRTNARMDSFRSVLSRFDITVFRWEGFNGIAFMAILPEKLEKTKKFR